MFSQELLTNGELNHFSLKERMVEIGKRWHKLSPSQKEKYKKLVEEQQVEYKVELEAWVKVRFCRPLMAADRINYKKEAFASSCCQSDPFMSRHRLCPRRTEPSTRSSPPQ